MNLMLKLRSGAALLIAALGVVLMITACGGGGGGSGSVAGGGIGGTGITTGQITGFGSVIVNGQKFDVESGTQITIDDNAGQPQTNLQVGMIVTVEHTNFTNGRLRADKINYQSDVRGSIALSGQTLSVAGQTVIITDRTCVQDGADQTQCVTGADALTLLQSISAADICGNRDANGQLRATRVRKSASTTAEVRGQVSALAATTFVLNGLTVNYASAAVTGTLADGATVEVKAPQGPVGNVLTASEVKVENSGGGSSGSGSSIEVENLITRFASAADFDVGSQKVRTTASTQYENGNAANLSASIKVKVKGKLDSSNVLVADLVSLRPTIEIEATVTSVNTAEASLTVLGSQPGVKVKTNTLTTFKGGSGGATFGFAQIVVGDSLKIRAQQTGSDIIATRIERVSGLNRVVLRAPVTAVSNPSLTLLGISVSTTASTQFESELGSVSDQSSFFNSVTANQSVVKAQGSFVAPSTIIADEAEIELPD